LNGGERAFSEMIEALSLSGHKVYAIFPYEGPIIEKCKDYLVDYSIQRQSWWLDRGVPLLMKDKLRLIKKLLKDIKATNSIIKRYNPNIVITSSIVIPCGAVSSKLCRKKHIWFLHEFGKDDHNFNFIYGKKLTVWLINKLSSKILCNSDFLKSYFSKYIRNERKFQTVYNAVKNNDMPFTHHNQSLSLIFTGRFAEGKGQLEAVQAIKILVEKGVKDIQLLLVGADGDSYSQSVKKYVETYHLEDNVEIIDFCKDVTQYYQKANVGLVCSRCEAFGRVTIESMKMGLPAIVSNTGANPELVTDGFNGYIYEYGNPQDLVNKILLMKDETTRLKMAQQAYCWAIKKFSIENFKRDLDKAIENIEL